MPTLDVTATRLTGGHFLLADTAPADVFTPEDLSPEDRQMADTAEKFMDKEVLPRVDALEHQEPGLARSLFEQAGQLGLLALEVPEIHGGLDLGKTSAIGVNQQLSRLAGFGITCGAHTGIGSQPLMYFGADEQKARYLPRLATGEWMAAYCLSEADSGSDALGMKTRATLSPDGDHYVLNGVKMWITNAAWADLFTVFAKVDGEHVTAFLVERTFPGVSTGAEEHKLGIKSSSTRRLILEDVKVPVANVLGAVGQGAYIAFNILNFGRYSLAAGIIGAAREQLRVATRYALERTQFGRPVATFGLIREKLADMAAKIFADESAVYRTAGLIDEVFATGDTLDTTTPPFPRALDEFALECSILKICCTEHLFEIADEAIQVLGGYGFTEEFSPARALRDARINRIFEGTNEINRLFIPGLLQRREQRGRFPLAATIKHVFAHLAEPAPATPDTPLHAARVLLLDARKLVFFLSGLAAEKFGARLAHEQEISAALGNLVCELYLSESAVLRAEKSRILNHTTHALHADLALLYVNAAVLRMSAAAQRVLEAAAAPETLHAHLETVRRLLPWTPPNSIALRRRVAESICEHGDYPA